MEKVQGLVGLMDSGVLHYAHPIKFDPVFVSRKGLLARAKAITQNTQVVLDSLKEALRIANEKGYKEIIEILEQREYNRAEPRDYSSSSQNLLEP